MGSCDDTCLVYLRIDQLVVHPLRIYTPRLYVLIKYLSIAMLDALFITARQQDEFVDHSIFLVHIFELRNAKQETATKVQYFSNEVELIWESTVVHQIFVRLIIVIYIVDLHKPRANDFPFLKGDSDLWHHKY